MRQLFRRMARRVVPRAARNWLRAPRATMAWFVDAIRFRAGYRPMLALNATVTIRCHPAALRTAFAPVLADPMQREELASFLATARSDMVLFDIGAHFGLFSFAALRAAGAGARAVAVDASPVATRMLTLQTRLNAMEGQVTIRTTAVGESEGTLSLVPVGVLAAGYYTAAGMDHPLSERVTVRTTTIDALAAEFGDPTHLKIDIEGHEAGALHGAARTLRSARPLVFLEVHGDMIRAAHQRPADPLDLLIAAGYQLTTTAGHHLNVAEAAAASLIRVVARPTSSSSIP